MSDKSEELPWLFRNSFRYQLTPDRRLVGKLNHSFSDSGLGDFYPGGYTEAVMGSWSIGGKYAYRLGEVSLDRLNPDFFDNTAHLGVLRVD